MVAAEAALKRTPRPFEPTVGLAAATVTGVPLPAAGLGCWNLTYLLPALAAAGLAVDATLVLPLTAEPLLLEGGTTLLDGRRLEAVPTLPLVDEGLLTWPLDGAALLDPALSAWATPDPPASAAPKPNVIAPAPTHAYGSR